jgi:non-canonical (house-cleaning) NTP pyrophosphatase
LEVHPRPAYPFAVMSKIIFAVGSIRRPKLAAVERALKTLAPLFPAGAEFEILGIEVPSGVSHTPTSREELMRGARTRAEALVEIARVENRNWNYFIGLEGGLDVVTENNRRFVFLESWVYVTNISGRAAFGQAGALLTPDELAAEVLDRGVELSVAIDAFAGEKGIRDTNGAWGVLTKNVITREDAFHFALLNAFAPFINAEFYAQK